MTPAELRDWPLAGNAAGRIGGVRLELVGDVAGTRLGACYQQVPLRVLPPFRFGPGQPALLYLLNPTAGLMDGDAQLAQIHAGPGTLAVVVGQSATRIHPSLRGYSTQQWRIEVDSSAVLVVLPGPAIPFRHCRYCQHVAIDLAQGAGLVWGQRADQVIWPPGHFDKQVARRVLERILLRRCKLRFGHLASWPLSPPLREGGHQAGMGLRASPKSV